MEGGIEMLGSFPVVSYGYTITYKSPFFKKCREDDYKEAWEMLEKREEVR